MTGQASYAAAKAKAGCAHRANDLPPEYIHPFVHDPYFNGTVRRGGGLPSLGVPTCLAEPSAATAAWQRFACTGRGGGLG